MKEHVLQLKRKGREILILFFVLMSQTVLAQEKVTVRGVVKDATGGLPGVSVKATGAATGTVTDISGAFKIQVNPKSVLVFSFVGYKNQQVDISKQTFNSNGECILSINLSPEDNSLKEVVVVGFGTQKKESTVSSITTINPKELKGPTSNLTTMLQGRVSGMIAYQRSGEPGADNAQFFIRGLGSFGSGKVDPLILIDGMESTQNDMARLQPDDIASFSVLKDATAAAVYGARGANGVVLITTKSGVEGKTKFTFRAENSASSNTRNFQFADNITYMNLANEAEMTRPSANQQLPYWQTKIDHTAAGDDPLLYPSNNWIDKLIRDYTMNQRFNLSVSGGGPKARYYVAGTYNVDNGVLKVDPINNFNSNIKLINYSVRSNVNLNLTPTTEAIIRVYAQFDDYRGPVGGYDGNGNRINGGQRIFNMALWSNPVMFAPVYPSSFSPYTTHPMFGNAISRSGGLLTNPYAEMVRGYQEYSTATVLPQLEVKQDLNKLLKGLSARVMSNIRRYSYFDVIRQYNPFYYSSMVSPMNGGLILDPINDGGTGSIGTVGTEYLNYTPGAKDLSSMFYVESAVNYNQTFAKKHAVTGMLIGLMQNRLTANAASLQQSLPARNMGVSGRFTYGYDNRYIAEVNFGYNGTERFAKNNRMGFFPSVGLAYNISNEKFFENFLNTISNFKLRASYGLVGNDQIGNVNERFLYLSEVNMNDAAYSSVFGQQYNYNRAGISINRYGNSLITWETSKQINLGADLRLFNALDMNIDVYKQTRSNILTARSFVPTSMGLEASIIANTNKMESKGVDVALAYNKNLSRNWSMHYRGNMTYATNKRIIVDEPAYEEAYQYRAGTSSAQMFGYIAERLFVDDEETLNSPIQFGLRPGVDYLGGDIKYKDLNRDGLISSDDQVPIGLPTTPEIVYGFGGTLGYKGWDFSAFFQGVARTSFMINSQNISPFYLNGGSQNGLLKGIADSHWSESNRDSYAFWPRLSSGLIANNNQSSTWWLRNGAFMRLKNVEVGFTPKDKFLSRLHLSNMRLYLNATNLFVVSKYKIWDPEMGSSGLGYPVQSVYNLGVNVAF